mgnify:CR=1 FL=1
MSRTMSGLGATGDALLAGGTATAPQTFTGFNQFDELTKFETTRPQLDATATTTNPTDTEFITKADGVDLFGSLTNNAQLDGGVSIGEPQTFTGFNEFENTTKFEVVEMAAPTGVFTKLKQTDPISNVIEQELTDITSFQGNLLYQHGGTVNKISQEATGTYFNQIKQVGTNSEIITDGTIEADGNIIAGNQLRSSSARINNQLYMNGYGLYYRGSNGAGSANGIAFKWTSPYMYGRVDNVVDMVVGNASDRRLKKNIKSIPPETSRKFLDVIKPRSYNSANYDVSGCDRSGNDMSGNDIKISCDCDKIIYGGVAQEIEEDFPELVHSPKDDGIKSLLSESIVFMTISSLQLIDKNVKELHERILKLEAAANNSD